MRAYCSLLNLTFQVGPILLVGYRVNFGTVRFRLDLLERVYRILEHFKSFSRFACYPWIPLWCGVSWIMLHGAIVYSGMVHIKNCEVSTHHQ